MNVPSIPENFYRFLLLAGILIFGYGQYSFEKDINTFNTQIRSARERIDSAELFIMDYQFLKQELVETASFLSARNNVTNPIVSTDSSLKFQRSVLGSSKEMFVTDTIMKLWAQYKMKLHQHAKMDSLRSFKNDELAQARIEFDSSSRVNEFLTVGGGIIFFLGFVLVARYQGLQDDLLLRQLNEKEKYYKFCQSCGRNFNSVIKPGKNIESGLNKAYCSKCYDDGVFIEPELSQSEMKMRFDKEVKKQFPWFIQRWLARMRFKELDRWYPDDYR